MSLLKSRVRKLEQKDNDYDFDLTRPVKEWSMAELLAYKKSQNPDYKPPDYSGFSLDELRKMRDENQCNQR